MGSLNRVVLREARREDVPAIVALLADDHLGAQREALGPPLPPGYLEAFAEIDADPNQILLVAQDGAEIVGTLQLTFILGLSRQGARRAQMESVRVAAARRNQRIGESMVRWAVEEATRRGCRVLQLTTHRTRPDAFRFYERLGFEATHHGMKLPLT